MENIKFKDIAYSIEPVRKLVIYNSNGVGIEKTIPIYDAITGEARQYFDYYVSQIRTEIVFEKTFLDHKAELQAIITVYLVKNLMEEN